MEVYKALADTLLGFHILYIVVLFIGTFAALFGYMRRHRKSSIFFFANLIATMFWQIAPGCPLTESERWLRLKVDPNWTTSTPLPEAITEKIFGVDLPYELFFGVGLAWVGLSVIAMIQTYKPRSVIATTNESVDKATLRKE